MNNGGAGQHRGSRPFCQKPYLLLTTTFQRLVGGVSFAWYHTARISGNPRMTGIHREMRLADLEKIDPARRMSRFYAIGVTKTLFGQGAVVPEWGRIGQAGAAHENWIESDREASAAGTTLRRQKERRGYRAL